MSEHLIGKPLFFDENPFLDAANILVASDEPLKALELIKLVPGYFRDHPPKSFTELRDKIEAKLATPFFYSQNIWDLHDDDELAEQLLKTTARGHFISQDVKRMNDRGITPHIVDLGPGEYWLPIALNRTGLKFTYQGLGLSPAAEQMAIKKLGDIMKPSTVGPVIYVACEIIEHLHYERDIKVDIARLGYKPEIIHVSTPKYTYDIRKERLQWESMGDLGHLRTYTPDEFCSVVTKMFPDYAWGYSDGNVMHLRGIITKGG